MSTFDFGGWKEEVGVVSDASHDLVAILIFALLMGGAELMKNREHIICTRQSLGALQPSYNKNTQLL